VFLSFPLRAGSPIPLYELYPLCFPLVYSAVLLELSHVQVSPTRDPFLALLDCHSTH
jgi:hypothetical protein